ncbi:hypothetical protein L207DRAFT_511897 [Hyaloscypha variabilis F]|uniref:Uncharacterized protein n=1 Tax=Hyaloscypha variabilis (strain UAMH 11265 / GT02V1 / F) TaxID=1149755 RepID=A0A2J6RPG3_HYAVF|nr:hypothetical protein L207DRAFT_511897 [Hyaloscypha variabilis F]
MLSTGDVLSLSFGLIGTLVALATIVATIMVRDRSREQDIEMQALTQPASEHEITLRAVETVLGLFRSST